MLFVCAGIVLVQINCGGGIGTPIIINPTRGEEVALPVTLSWQPVVNAERYLVEIDTVFDLSTALSAEPTDTVYTIGSLSLAMHYWHVAAYDDKGDLGDFCEIDSFLVKSDSIQ
jgi:hypothetical protein